MNRFKSNKVNVPYNHLDKSSNKIELTHAQMDLVEHAVFGNFGATNPNLNPAARKSKR